MRDLFYAACFIAAGLIVAALAVLAFDMQDIVNAIR
jgi:hypothetical protein